MVKYKKRIMSSALVSDSSESSSTELDKMSNHNKMDKASIVHKACMYSSYSGTSESDNNLTLDKKNRKKYETHVIKLAPPKISQDDFISSTVSVKKESTHDSVTPESNNVWTESTKSGESNMQQPKNSAPPKKVRHREVSIEKKITQNWEVISLDESDSDKSGSDNTLVGDHLVQMTQKKGELKTFICNQIEQVMKKQVKKMHLVAKKKKKMKTGPTTRNQEKKMALKKKSKLYKKAMVIRSQSKKRKKGELQHQKAKKCGEDSHQPVKKFRISDFYSVEAVANENDRVSEASHSRHETTNDCLITRNKLSEIWLPRYKLERWLIAPFFKKTVTGCFVRIWIENIDGDHGDGKYYIAEIADVVVTGANYRLGDSLTDRGLKLKHCFEDRVFQFELVSNSYFSDSEFTNWKETLLLKKNSLPTMGDITRKFMDVEMALKKEDEAKMMTWFMGPPSSHYGYEMNRTKLMTMAKNMENLDGISRYITELEQIEEKAKELDKMRASTINSIKEFLNMGGKKGTGV